jgi:hypothetical protein
LNIERGHVHELKVADLGAHGPFVQALVLVLRPVAEPRLHDREPVVRDELVNRLARGLDELSEVDAPLLRRRVPQRVLLRAVNGVALERCQRSPSASRKATGKTVDAVGQLSFSPNGASVQSFLPCRFEPDHISGLQVRRNSLKDDEGAKNACLRWREVVVTGLRITAGAIFARTRIQTRQCGALLARRCST